MSMSDCPVELLDMIVDRVSSGKGLRSLRAVDKTFCALATPRAFRQVYVTNSLPSALGLKALMDCDKLAKTVERIVFRWSEPSELVTDSVAARATFVALVTIFAQLHKFPALVALALELCPGLRGQSITVNEDGQIDLSRQSTEAGLVQSTIVQALLRNRDLPRLKSLTLANLIAFPFAYYESQPFADMLSSVEHLHLTLHGMSSLDGPGAPETWSWMWQEMVPIHFLGPPQSRLTSLTLTSDQPVGRFPRLDLSGLFFPALRRLELGGIMFDHHRRIEDFIVRHGQSLVTLVLDSCPMHVESLDGAPERPWREVCDRLARELEALIDLRVYLRTGWGLDDLDRSEEVRLTYECQSDGTGYGYARGETTKMLEALDRPALEQLLEKVRTRKAKQAKEPSLPSHIGDPVEVPLAEPASASFVIPIHWV
ncbi:hypothetical protein BV20DRAFT_239304 [Pilatotrama ljubarskyi]|nr:hypothetical protein BV20DRAFT_239304 [Pilatotrama ljubarskyi]